MRYGHLIVAMALAALAARPSAAQQADQRGPTSTIVVAGEKVRVTPLVVDASTSIEVKLGADSFVVPAGPAFSDRLPDLPANVQVDQGYLLVHYECGCTSHVSPISFVFAVRDGRLRQLGTFVDDWGPAPRPLDFITLDDQIEYNGLTSHAGGPGVRVPLREVLHRFRFDPSRCWPVNRAGYEKAMSEIPTFTHLALGHETVVSNLEYIAAVDRYCGRPEALGNDFALAQNLLSPQDFTHFHKLISAIIVGHLPQ